MITAMATMVIVQGVVMRRVWHGRRTWRRCERMRARACMRAHEGPLATLAARARALQEHVG